MPKHVLDVGQCGPDHATIRRYLTNNFDCDISKANDAGEALAQLKSARFDLVLVNRKLDIDYTDGIEVIRQIKADPAIADVPVMLVTNYPEHQEAAIAEGAIRGFGKLEYDKPETRERLAAVLEAASVSQ
jgi:two-component system chemotaxis response regulator CheY